MNIVEKFKSLLLSGAIAFSKAEKDILQEIMSKSNPDMQIEDQVRQNEIKIISESRFYKILNDADLYISKRDEGKMMAMLESRGLSNVELILENGRRSAEFKTTNGLFKYANLVHISDIGGNKELKFFINIIDHPEMKSEHHRLSNLEFFEVENQFKKYEYEINRFVGVENPDAYTITLKYHATPLVNGRSILNEGDDSVRVMRKEDLIDPKSINFTDHLRNGFNG